VADDLYPGAALGVLRERFGYDGFRPGQGEVVEQLLAGRDCLAVMPTGAGKSLCFQVPALLQPGLSIVVSPLISLMKDQVSALRDNGIAATCLNSTLSVAEQHEVLRLVALKSLKLLYVAPERLRSPDFLAAVAGIELSLVAVDEAHCISQWGQDFRPSYLDIPRFIDSLPVRPPVGAFTATATLQVRDDIKLLLGLQEPFELVSGFDRPNLFFEIRRPKGRDGKERELLGFLRSRPGESGIIYCSTRNATEEVCELLCAEGLPATRYHAGLSDVERHRNQEDFVYDRRSIMVATNAFGMGIDKSNVSYVVHFNMPMNLEGYYQEAGRAGRDGSPATCLLLYAPADVRTCEYIITHSNDGPDVDPETRAVLVAHDLELLRQMTFYATTNDCLRHHILRYFGEAAPISCGNCSNCLSAFEEVDATVDAQKIISCLHHLRKQGRQLGKTAVVGILRGSRERRLLDMGADQLSTYGIMAMSSVHRVRMIIDTLVEQGYLTLTGSEYPTLQWNSRTHELLPGGTSLHIKLPIEKPAAEDTEKGGGKRRRKRHGSDGGESAVDAGIDAGPVDSALFARLKDLRTTIAREEGKPAYIVFSDATLRDMCRRLPGNEAEFLEVSGVGQTKLERYGEQFLQALQDYTGR
jgi:ATP-dependent DNA helicase RecQ